MDGYIYFAERGNLIKIGFSSSPRDRVGGLRQCRLLGGIPGDRKSERRLHEKFLKYRSTGEWFNDSPEIRDYVLNHTTLLGLPEKLGLVRTVKIGENEYWALKNLAEKRGCFMQFLLTEAIRQYLATEQSKEQAA